MQNGADAKIKTPGETAMDLAEINGFTNIVEILKNHTSSWIANTSFVLMFNVFKILK